MYKNNSRNSSKFKGCSPLQNCIGLISLKPAIAYFAYTKRYKPLMRVYMKYILQISIFLLVLNITDIFAQKSEVNKPNITWRRIELGVYKDSISFNIVEFQLFEGLTYYGGTTLEPLENDYVLTHYSNGSKHLIVLEKLYPNGDGTNKSKILDMIEVTGLSKNQHVSYGFCSIKSINDSEIITVYEFENTEEFTKILKAWRATRKNGRIIEINTGGISCINEGYGA